MSDELPQLEERRQELHARIAELAQEEGRVSQRIAELKSPFAVGDVIEWGWGTKPSYRGLVRAVESRYGQPAWRVARLLKDGSYGQNIKVCHLQRPTLVEKGTT